MQTEPLHPAVHVGHVLLRVADLQRAIAFYRDALGFSLTAEFTEHNTALLAAGDYHHHIGLTALPSAGGSPNPRGGMGLGHVAFLYPDRRELGRAIRRLLDHGHEIDRATDRGAAASVYLTDPDGNEIELYYDHPRAACFDANRRPMLTDEPVNPAALLRCIHGEPRVPHPDRQPPTRNRPPIRGIPSRSNTESALPVVDSVSHSPHARRSAP